ncbi:helix-turn-helix domain-containing protein [Streptomyces sp. NBC_01477]|uniref:helix-turn-helix domain-containing protein n=1 Tax=Streptomyces sp. NBC_01477 TaxID=2976015 RepID=UPI002E366CE9|nr:helix-turn-helix transcriptional regulator [Streptomyces sp. NBC_01477]
MRVRFPRRTCTIATDSGEVVSGHLPFWAGEDPTRTGVRRQGLRAALVDVVFGATAGSLVLPVACGQEVAEEAPVLVVTIGYKPSCTGGPVGHRGPPRMGLHKTSHLGAVVTIRRVRTRPRVLDHEPEAVTWARKKAGLTKRALAERLGISEQLMGEIESGWRNATPANLAKIAKELNCPRVFLERKHTEG